jgi:fatty acid desaturase
VIAAGLVVPAILLYGIPSITILNLIIRFRTIAEHSQTEGAHELNAARTVEPTWLERLLIAPHGVNYHIEHHLFPSVPGPNLGRLHQVMLTDEEYRTGAHLTPSYTGFVRELLGGR